MVGYEGKPVPLVWGDETDVDLRHFNKETEDQAATNCYYQAASLLFNLHMLVGGLVAIFYFPIYIGLLIIPIDELIFFRGVA